MKVKPLSVDEISSISSPLVVSTLKEGKEKLESNINEIMQRAIVLVLFNMVISPISHNKD